MCHKILSGNVLMFNILMKNRWCIRNIPKKIKIKKYIVKLEMKMLVILWTGNLLQNKHNLLIYKNANVIQCIVRRMCNILSFK